MGIQVYEDTNTGNAVITLGQNFDSRSRKEFSAAYSQFEPYRNFLLDFEPVEKVDSSSFGMLLRMREYAKGLDSTITISGCDENIASTLELPILEGLFELKN
jgi:HptB-dependent secretion and biofilm anti anti-sigma factor